MATDGKKSRFVVFIDVLGIRRALSLGFADVADRKISHLAAIVAKVLQAYPSLHAHGATDCFLIWAEAGEPSWEIVAATGFILQQYFDLNETEKIVDLERTYLLRAGLAHGDARLHALQSGNLSHAFLLGDGLARAYEAQALLPGMRFLLSHHSIQSASHNPAKRPEGIPAIRLHKTHDHIGKVEAYDYLWAGSPEYAEKRLPRACALFELALSEFRKDRIPERVLIQYQETVRAIMRSCANSNLLLRYTTWQYERVKYDKYYAGIWAAAWVRIFDVLEEKDLKRLKTALRDKYIRVAGSRVAGIVSEELKRRSLWKDVVRILKTS
jgi:hypothetical protein